MKDKSGQCIRILAVGDVIGRPGRQFLRRTLPVLKARYDYDGLVVNVENAAGGFGMTLDVYREFEDMHVDCMTSGNHIFDKRGYEDWFPWAPRLLRPLNFPDQSPGKGYHIFQLPDGLKVGVLNTIGRTFMKPYNCPFRAADAALAVLSQETNIILVDFHGEATSEKMAMGWYLSKRVSVVWGTHTHVPTADGRILDDFTGYQTDLGMTGPHDSIIGMTKEPVIQGFLTLERSRFEVAKRDVRLGGCLFDIDRTSGRCTQLKSLFLDEGDLIKIEGAASQAYHN